MQGGEGAQSCSTARGWGGGGGLGTCSVAVPQHATHPFPQEAPASSVLPAPAAASPGPWPIPMGPMDAELVPTAFQWLGAASAVYLCGTFNNWGERLAMNLKESHRGDEWYLVLNLPPGEYAYKFVVHGHDGQVEWRHAPEHAALLDAHGHCNNWLSVVDQWAYERDAPSLSLTLAGFAPRPAYEEAPTAGGESFDQEEGYSQSVPEQFFEMLFAAEPPSLPAFLAGPPPVPVPEAPPAPAGEPPSWQPSPQQQAPPPQPQWQPQPEYLLPQPVLPPRPHRGHQRSNSCDTPLRMPSASPFDFMRQPLAFSRAAPPAPEPPPLDTSLPPYTSPWVDAVPSPVYREPPTTGPPHPVHATLLHLTLEADAEAEWAHEMTINDEIPACSAALNPTPSQVEVVSPSSSSSSPVAMANSDAPSTKPPAIPAVRVMRTTLRHRTKYVTLELVKPGRFP